jgi:SAM-dependent methyltransferase
MDLSPVLQDYHARAGRLRVVRADALRVPARERAFDMVTCLGLVEHLDDPIAALSELRRVTCGSGRAVVSVPRRLGLFPLLVPLWYWSGGRHRYGWRSMVGRMYSGALLRSQLAAAGWAVEDVRTFKGGSVLEWLGVPYSHRRARWAEGSWFGRRALSIMVAAVCRNPGPP